MNTIYAPLLQTMRSLFLAEAGGIAGQSLRQCAFGQDLVDIPADHGMLTGANQVQIFTFYFVHHGIHIVLAHDALHHVAMDHEGGNAIGKSLIDHEVSGIGQHAFMQPGNIPQQIVESLTGNTPCGIHINAVKALHDLRMIGNGEIRHHRFSKAGDLHIAAVIRSDRHGWIDDIGNEHHPPADLLGILPFQLLQFCQTLRLCFYLRLYFLCFRQFGRILFSLSHEHPHLFGKGISGSPQVAGLLNGGTVFSVQFQHLVYQRELGVLKLFADVFLDQLGVVANKLDIQHGFSPVLLCFYLFVIF